MRRLSLLAAGCAAAVSAAAGAVDLGTQGSVFPIDEPNLLIEILDRLDAVDWKKKSADIARDDEYLVNHMPDDGLTPAPETLTRYYDPSLVLQAPVSAPVRQDDGSTQWKVIYPAGTRVNPLEHVQPPTRLLVFDPSDKGQTAFALAAQRAWPSLVELMVSGGAVKDLSKQISRPVYYADAALVHGFHLEHVPSMIGVGKGPLSTQLAVTEYGPHDLDPVTAPDLIRRSWYGLPPKDGTKGGEKEKEAGSVHP